MAGAPLKVLTKNVIDEKYECNNYNQYLVTVRFISEEDLGEGRIFDESKCREVAAKTYRWGEEWSLTIESFGIKNYVQAGSKSICASSRASSSSYLWLDSLFLATFTVVYKKRSAKSRKDACCDSFIDVKRQHVHFVTNLTIFFEYLFWNWTPTLWWKHFINYW